MWPQLRLSSWITIGVVAIVLITTLSLLLVVNQFARNYARNEAEVRLKQLAWQMRDVLDQSMKERVLDIKNLARRGALRDTSDPQRLRAILDQAQNDFADYAWIGIAGPDGKVIASTRAMLEGQSVAQRGWFIGGQKQLYMGNYHPAQLLEKVLPYAQQPWRFVDIALPVFDGKGVYKGVLGAHLSWAWARAMAGNLLNPNNSRYQVDVLVVRDDGVVLLGPKDMEEKIIHSASLDLARRGISDALVERWGDGTRYITGYARTGSWAGDAGLNWSILVRQPERVALADFVALEKQVLLGGGLAGLLLVVCAILASRKLVAPMNALSAAIESRATGGVEADIPLVRSYYEISLLSSTLAAMVERESKHLAEVNSLNENLEYHVTERTGQLQETAQALRLALEEQQESQALLEESENELRAILQNANDAFIAIDETGRILEWNRQAEQLFGWRRDEALGQFMDRMIVPEDLRENHLRGMRRYLETRKGILINSRIEINALRRDGSELPVELVIGHVERRAGHMFIAFLHDITERQALRSTLESLAFTDMLTGLLNRRAFTQKLPEAMARSARHREPMALLFMDIDGFKGINDTYGHDAGDELLRLFAARIQHEVRDIDTVSRLAGDEFTVILERLAQGADAAEVAHKILLAMREPFALAAASVSISTSIGVTLFAHDDDATPETLTAAADAAMYVAKRAGKDRIHIA
jgi:diguanylate cyclase (GGDEF)-like protein/PAS domain S-box-containing protein